jgi:hypothetical protein
MNPAVLTAERWLEFQPIELQAGSTNGSSSPPHYFTSCFLVGATTSARRVDIVWPQIYVHVRQYASSACNTDSIRVFRGRSTSVLVKVM